MYDEYAIDFCYGFADAQEVFRIRRLSSLLLESNATSLNLDRAVVIVDEINSRGPLACHAVLGAVYERLYRRKGLYLALELLEFCVRNCGLEFAVFLRRPFLKAMTRLLKLKSLTEQTLIGQVNSTVKSLYKTSRKRVVGGDWSPEPKNILVSSDVILVRCQRKVLYLFQLWADAFMLHEDRVPDIMQMYRELRQKGYPFPARNPNERYFVKHAENSPIFTSVEKVKNNKITSLKNGKSVNSLKSTSHMVYESKPLTMSKQNEASKESFCNTTCSPCVSNERCLLDEKDFQMEENLNDQPNFSSKKNEKTLVTHDKTTQPETLVTTSDIKKTKSQGNKALLTMVLNNNVESCPSVNSKEKETCVPPLLPPPEALLKQESLQDQLAKEKEKFSNDLFVFSNEKIKDPKNLCDTSSPPFDLFS